MTDRKYFNVTLSRGMIAQAYQDNESYDSHCFLIGPVSSYLPEGFKIFGAVIDNGNLIVEYENKTSYQALFYIVDGVLFLKLVEGGKTMALVDLGNVIGPQGATGAQGPQGETGAQGPQGPAGIVPTFVMGDGTGGTTAGHLYADYDNPYNPNP